MTSVQNIRIIDMRKFTNWLTKISQTDSLPDDVVSEEQEDQAEQIISPIQENSDLIEKMTVYLPVFSATYNEFNGRGQIISKTTYTSREMAESETASFYEKIGTYSDHDAQINIVEIQIVN